MTSRDARLALSLYRRRDLIQSHAYTIDPGMRLARELYFKSLRPVILVMDPPLLKIPDRTMPQVKESFGPPTTEMVLDDFDIWIGGR